MKCLQALLAAVVLFWGAGTAASDSGEDLAELERTFLAARVYLPVPSSPWVRQVDVAALMRDGLPAGDPPKAVILYAHGCDGLSRITDSSGWFLARAGYAVIAPDSFARLDKPVSCEPSRHRGSLHRGVLGWRQAELRHAVQRIRGLSSFARLPVVLVGHSEGAITVATLGGVAAAARVIEGWTCHAGWPEYKGLNAPAGQPVLALLGAVDPWFTLPVLKGDCGSLMIPSDLTRSIVYRAPHALHDQHWLSFDREVQDEILAFLAAALQRPETHE